MTLMYLRADILSSPHLLSREDYGGLLHLENTHIEAVQDLGIPIGLLDLRLLQ